MFWRTLSIAELTTHLEHTRVDFHSDGEIEKMEMVNVNERPNFPVAIGIGGVRSLSLTCAV